MLTPKEFAFATPQDLGGTAAYRRVCKVAGLNPVPDGYGMLLATDENGDKYTLVTGDVEYVRAIAEAGTETLASLELPPDKFLNRAGWPDDWI
ncbi:hypothetical protein ACFWN1_17855 [Streptomyces sp. NPDC058459]|uniref:hypothetical protein n=1 Tax=Streptomyces sp. NPDC058459 TaxID=3346508 RepID=UPI0036645207